jgi:hypothetical protein
VSRSSLVKRAKVDGDKDASSKEVDGILFGILDAVKNIGRLLVGL